MSRVGKQPVPIPDGIKVSLEDGQFVAEGPKGRVSERLLEGIPVEIGDALHPDDRRSEEGALPRRVEARDQAALAAGGLHMGGDVVAGGFGDHGAHIRRGIPGVAEAKLTFIEVPREAPAP